MTTIQNTLPKMLALAREQSELSRVQLAGMLADVYIECGSSLSLREEEMINELIDELMANSDPKVRGHLLEKFSDPIQMPRRIAANLSMGALDVAQPILLASAMLTDSDLVTVVERKGIDYALVVAARTQVSEAVADALVTTGDIRVMRIVAENLGAQLSPVAIEAVADAARYAAELRMPALYRPEMKTDLALKLYWWVDQDLRRYALKRFGITAGQVDKALATTITSFLNDHAHQKYNDNVMEQVAEWMDSHQAVTAQILPQVLRMGHFRLFNILLARMSRLSLSLVDTIVAETGGRGLASICRAIDIDKSGFVSLFLLSRGSRTGEHIVHPRELSHALATFDRMSPSLAKDLLHSWDVNPEYFEKRKDDPSPTERSYY